MLTDYLANLRLIGRDARLLIAAQTIMAFGYVGMYSVLFNLYLLRLGYDPAAVGEINAIGPWDSPWSASPQGYWACASVRAPC